jgi:hypothetical protein
VARIILGRWGVIARRAAPPYSRYGGAPSGDCISNQADALFLARHAFDRAHLGLDATCKWAEYPVAVGSYRAGTAAPSTLTYLLNVFVYFVLFIFSVFYLLLQFVLLI